MKRKYAHDGGRKQTSTHLVIGYYLMANKIYKKYVYMKNKIRGIMSKWTLHYSLF